MEIAQEKSATDLRNQMHQRGQVAEMESELQKQRIRALNILAEKENELEITKGILASVRNQPNVDPVDPPQNTSFRSMKQRKNRSRDMCGSNASINERRSGEIWNVIDHSASDVDSCSSVVDEHHSECLSVSPNSTQALFASGTTAVIETRNIFYEQQLVKKEKQIIELRNAMRITELTVRDMQQATLTKDLQHFEMVEKLKDEIRILEGKLKFLTADSNMEYLRNIFIQLLYCDSSSRRKHILKAIGAVLKLSVTEMRAIEKPQVDAKEFCKPENPPVHNLIFSSNEPALNRSQSELLLKTALEVAKIMPQNGSNNKLQLSDELSPRPSTINFALDRFHEDVAYAQLKLINNSKQLIVWKLKTNNKCITALPRGSGLIPSLKINDISMDHIQSDTDHVYIVDNAPIHQIVLVSENTYHSETKPILQTFVSTEKSIRPRTNSITVTAIKNDITVKSKAEFTNTEIVWKIGVICCTTVMLCLILKAILENDFFF
ncbi:BMA-KLP-8 [Dirofilaria immitis]|nr:BMA-KLP-8 [Dirofilaria immitis]